MKIGLYDPYLDDNGGGEKYMLTIAEILSKNNHNVDLFWDNIEDVKHSEKRFSLKLSKINVKSNIFKTSVSTLRRYLISRNYDLIIYLSDGSIPVLACKLFIHIQRPLDTLQGGILGYIKRQRVKTFFCNSYYTKSFIDKKFHIKSIVIYPPVDLSPTKVQKKNIILHVGRFRIFDSIVGVDDFKKQNFMLSTFKKLVDQGIKNWRMTMVVSVKDEDLTKFNEMKKTVMNYPVDFVVNKDNDILWEYYSKAKIYWHASGYGEDLILYPERAEHFGISTVEAMSAGDVPVVINAGGQKEIVRDGEDGYLWDNQEELLEKTIRLISSDKLLRSLSESAQGKARDFGRDIFEKNIIEMVTK